MAPDVGSRRTIFSSIGWVALLWLAYQAIWSATAFSKAGIMPGLTAESRIVARWPLRGGGVWAAWPKQT